jgi:hypothetical protein
MTKPKQAKISPEKGKSLSVRKKGITTHSNSAEAIQKQITLEDEYLVDSDNELDVPGVHARHRNRNTDKSVERGKRSNATRTAKRKMKPNDELTVPSTVQIIENVSRTLVVELAEVEAPGCVSVYLPARMSPHDVNEDANTINFRNLLQQVAPQVQEKKINPADVLKGGHSLLDNSSFWSDLPPGIAVFMTKDFCRVIKLPFAPRQQVVVNSSFHIAPLVPLLTDREYFFLLIISKKKASLFSCDHYNIRHIAIDEMPNGIEDVVHLEEKDDQKLFRTGSSGAGGGANYHGMGGGKPDEKDNISLYLKEVDRTLWSTILNNETAPLVVGGVDYLVTIFKGLTQYNNVWTDTLPGSLEYEDPRVLFEEARKLIRPYFEEKTRKALEAYANHSATDLVSMRPIDIVPAAYYSRVAKLFVEEGAELWGTFDKASNSIIIHKAQEKDDENLVDKAVLKTLLNGGEVHFLSSRDMPAHSAMAALMRY